MQANVVYLQAGVGWINPPSTDTHLSLPRESRLQHEHTSPTKIFSLSLESVLSFFWPIVDYRGHEEHFLSAAIPPEGDHILRGLKLYSFM